MATDTTSPMAGPNPRKNRPKAGPSGSKPAASEGKPAARPTPPEAGGAPAPEPGPPAAEGATMTPAPASPEEAPVVATTSKELRQARLVIDLVQGDLTKVAAPIALLGRYKGTLPHGAERQFDRLLHSWIHAAIEIGMLNPDLGEIFYLPVPPTNDLHRKIGGLLLVGMGEPGRFSREDLSLLMINATFAIKCLGCDEFSTVLIGAGNGGLSKSRALVGMLEGIRDGLRRLGDQDLDRIGKAASRHITVRLVEFDEHNYERIGRLLIRMQIEQEEAARRAGGGLPPSAVEAANVSWSWRLKDDDRWRREVEEERRKRARSDAAGAPPEDEAPEEPEGAVSITVGYSEAAGGDRAVFKYSAMSKTAVIPMREVTVHSYFSDGIGALLTRHKAAKDRDNDQCRAEQEQYGQLLETYLLPRDFEQLLDGEGPLTFLLDPETANIPWEMGGLADRSGIVFFGPHKQLTRQFRSLIAEVPGITPPLNHSLKVLVIADPAGEFPLPGARKEGLAVLKALKEARRTWDQEKRRPLDLKVIARIGAPDPGRTPDQILAEVKRAIGDEGNDFLISVDACRPLDVLAQILTQKFDVIHYAGHGIFDIENDRKGWVFGRRSILTASEIFKVRHVPRLVFANACYSGVVSRPEADGVDVTDPQATEFLGGDKPYEQTLREQAGLAEAFFARGIENYIGTGWPVEDGLALRFAEEFYRQVLGPGPSPPVTIGGALASARREILHEGATWGAYQHYGRATAKLLASPNRASFELLPGPGEIGRRPTAGAGGGTTGPATAAPTKGASPRPTVAAEARKESPAVEASPRPGPAPVAVAVATKAAGADRPAADDDAGLIYFNGIDAETGDYAIPPMRVEDLAERVRARPGGEELRELRGDEDEARAFGPPFGKDLKKLEDVGWAIVFHEDAPKELRDALAPLVEHRQGQAGDLLKVLDYKKGEQVRDWYRRHQISPGNLEPTAVPYYVLLVGPPTGIPFDFQYLLGVEYAVGRLALDGVADYARYAKSVVSYETAGKVGNSRDLVYWSTRHPNDPATNLSASLMIDPLANGMPDAVGALKQPIHEAVGYGRKLLGDDDATKAALLSTLASGKPPAVLFTASHGMAVNAGRPNQLADQGALVCQDWPGFGPPKPAHYLTAADVADDANVGGLVAFVFACFGGGTPVEDQFVRDLAKANLAAALAPEPFVAALPRRLLSHPRGSALAVIGHVDRAWGFSIQAPKTMGPQIGPFRNSLGNILIGSPVGHAIAEQFGQRFASLSTMLLTAVSPTTPANIRPSDRDLVTYWLERNDAQNYVVLGDPAVHIREDVLS